MDVTEVTTHVAAEERMGTGLLTTRAGDRVLTRALYYVFLFAVFFPYVRVAPVGSDVQPSAVALAALLVLGSTAGRLPRVIAPLFVVMVGSVLIAIPTGLSGVAVRGLANYFSLFLISFAAYALLKTERGLSRGFLKFTVWAWFVAGMAQTFISRAAFTQLLSNARTTADRGVVGLAPEPTSYGIHCMLLMLLVGELFTGRTRAVLRGALLVQIFLFARSSMTILFLIVWGLLFLATRAGARRAVVVGGSAFIVLVVALRALVGFAEKTKGIRVLELARLVVTTPSLILVRDNSISDRVAAITFSFMGAFQHWLIPHGFASWSQYILEIGPTMARYIPYYTVGDRIMSGYGAAIYELGFLGLVIPVVVTRSIALRYHRDRAKLVTIGVLLNLLLLTAIPLAYPPVAFLIGYFCYHGICRTGEPDDRHLVSDGIIPEPVPLT